MQWYKRHIGDWAKDTGHLSIHESGAYDKLITAYYRTELPLPPDLTKIYRMIGARTPQDRASIKNVLSEFFTLQSDGYHQKRCDAEISKYAAQRATNQYIGKRGGRPKTKTDSVPLSKTDSVPENNPNQEPRYKDLEVESPTRSHGTQHLKKLVEKITGKEPEAQNPDKPPDIDRNREIARLVAQGKNDEAEALSKSAQA